MDDSRPELIFYIAGCDIFQGDRYGGIRGVGLKEVKFHDSFVMREARSRRVPLVVSLGGGCVEYSGNKGEDEAKRRVLAKLHTNTLLVASELY